MSISFEYEEENQIVVNSETGKELFSNFMNKNSNHPDFPVPFNPCPLGKFKAEDTEELGSDGNWYLVSYFHAGWIQEIVLL